MTNERLISSLVKDGHLKTPRLIEAFRVIDRKSFVPQEFSEDAYANVPLPIGFGQTISQPLTVAFMLELLQPKPGEKVLDIGVGSGWQAALLAQAVGEKGKVIAIDRIPELKSMAEVNLNKFNFIKKGIVRIILGDGSKGYGKESPYNKIIVAATADKIPEEWKEQLKVGGRIVAPVGSSILLVNKISADKFETQEYFGFSFVPLVKG